MMKYLTPFFLVFIGLISCQETESETYIQFNGVEQNVNDTQLELIEEPIEENDAVARLSAVLVYYGLPSKYENGALYIPDSCAKTKDQIILLWNYTTKSNDSLWFDYHIMNRKNSGFLDDF